MMADLDKFEVVLDNTQAVYHEGDYISGHVDISNSVELRIKSIRLELKGVSVVFWTKLFLAKNESTGSEINKIKGDLSAVEYSEKVVFVQKGHRILTRGYHSFPFSCKLPPELPSSFEGEYGQIRYTAQAIIERPAFKSNIVCGRVFTVLSGLDLAFIPEASKRIEICKYKELGHNHADGSVTVDWIVDRCGFVSGEDICINGSVQNDSKRIISSSSVALYMIVTYKSKKRWRKERRKIVDGAKHSTPINEVTIWNDTLSIPPVPPTGLSRSKLIDITYELEFSVIIEGKQASIICSKAVYIGTIPLSGSETMPSYATMSKQKYHGRVLSTENLTQLDKGEHPEGNIRGSSHSLASLTDRILIIAGGPGNVDPSAPSVNTLERYEWWMDEVTLEEEERPPPFAPGHAENMESPYWPSAPTVNTLMRPWSVNQTFDDDASPDTTQAGVSPDTTQADTSPDKIQADTSPDTTQADASPDKTQADTSLDTAQADTLPDTIDSCNSTEVEAPPDTTDTFNSPEEAAVPDATQASSSPEDAVSCDEADVYVSPEVDVSSFTEDVSVESNHHHDSTFEPVYIYYQTLKRSENRKTEQLSE